MPRARSGAQAAKRGRSRPNTAGRSAGAAGGFPRAGFCPRGGPARGRRRSRRKVLATAGAATVAAAGAALVWTLRTPTVPPEARKHYELGQEFAKHRTHDDLTKAVKEYENAVKIEPTYGDAWAGLADAYSAMANFNFMPAR